MLTYSVAIRTLGKSPETLKRELQSLHSQTVLPEKIVIYIARGYERPRFSIGMEEYVETDKGMVAQRAVPYTEISSDCILLLDDDVSFEPDSIEKTLQLIELHQADCIAFDTFRNHEMSVPSKIKAAISGLVFPRFNQKWAFKIHWNDCFSYINKPGKGCYPSMSAAGPASLWRKEALLAMRFQDERWLDNFGFAYGDDGLEFYKLYLNGGRLMVTFDDGVSNLDAKTSSGDYQRSMEKFHTMAEALTVRWHRMHYTPTSSPLLKRLKFLSFGFRMMWQFGILTFISVSDTYRKAPGCFIRGIADGISYIKSSDYRELPPYLIKQNQ